MCQRGYLYAQQSMKVEFIINLKTAKSFAIDIPMSLGAEARGARRGCRPRVPAGPPRGPPFVRAVPGAQPPKAFWHFGVTSSIFSNGINEPKNHRRTCRWAPRQRGLPCAGRWFRLVCPGGWVPPPGLAGNASKIKRLPCCSVAGRDRMRWSCEQPEESQEVVPCAMSQPGAKPRRSTSARPC